MSSKFLTAEWRKLAIANYVIDQKILLPYLPYKTELDIWNDQCFVSLVGFCFINTKLKGIPIPFHRNFEEVNLRFYVRYKDSTGWRRGVVFIKEIVPRRALTFIANSIYHEKYTTLPMKHEWDIKKDLISISYSWKHNQIWNSFSLNADPNPVDIKIHSVEEFITEHYWGYTQLTKKKSTEYGVEHPRWKTYPMKGYDINVLFDKVYNNDFLFLNRQKPDSVMLAEGSEIIVRSGRRID